MREGEGSSMELLFSFGILVGRGEDILFQCGLVYLYTYQL